MSAAVVRLTMYSAHKSGATLVALAQPHFARAMQVTRASTKYATDQLVSGNPTMEQAQNTGLFDPIAVLLDLKFRKKGPLVDLKKADEGVPVYFIHELTGVVSCYHQIVKVLDGPVFGIQVPEAERNGGTISTIEGQAAKYVELIVGNQPEGPMRLVGWSAGSTIALEVARQLTSIGRQPQILINIDQPIDNSKGIVSPYHSFAENIYYWIRNEPIWPLSRLIRRIVEKFAQVIEGKKTHPSYNIESGIHKAQILINMAKTPEEGDFIRNFHDLVMEYIPPRSYSGRVLSFVASDNLGGERLVRSWKSFAPNSQFIFVSGDHLTLVRGADVAEVREHIREAFSKLPAARMPAPPAAEPNRHMAL
jgi:thioesterase domain-containing protein